MAPHAWAQPVPKGTCMLMLRQLRQLCVHRATTLKHMMRVGQRAVDRYHPPFRAADVVIKPSVSQPRLGCRRCHRAVYLVFNWRGNAFIRGRRRQVRVAKHVRGAVPVESQSHPTPMQRRRRSAILVTWHSGPVDAYRRRHISQ
jgi:hypothetical protein